MTALARHHLHKRAGSAPSCGCGGPVLSGIAAQLELDADLLDPTPRPRPPQTRTGTIVSRGATMLTIDEHFSEAEAIAIRGSHIVAVGSEAEVREVAGDDAEVIDRTGATILPGFIEPHAHLLPTALLDSWEDVGPFRFDTVDEVVAHLCSLDTPADGGWITGRQFDPSLQAGPDELTTDLLDTVSTTTPIVIMNASGHFAYVNSAALEAAGITADTPDIDGSPYGRFTDGTPNGVLKGQGSMMSVLTLNPGIRTLDIIGLARRVGERAAAAGVTTICDQGTGFLLGAGDVGLFETLAAEGALSTRLRYSLSDNHGDAFDLAGVVPGAGDELVRATGWKIVADGSNQGRTGFHRDPYLGTDDRGIAYVEPDVLIEKARLRASRGWQVVIHANGDQAIDNTLAALSAAVDAGEPDRRHRIEHCSILHDEQIAEIARLGVSPSFLIGHVYFWGQAFRDDIFGLAKAEMLDRTASCSAAGIRWTVHSDEMVTPMGPLRLIHNAVTRSLWREPDFVLNPAERVDVEAAIRSVTSDAAWQCHSDHEIGSLEPGKLADFVILDRDPRQVDPADLLDIEVLETWMDGERRF